MPPTSPRPNRDLRRSVLGLEAVAVTNESLVSPEASLGWVLSCETAGLTTSDGLTLVLLLSLLVIGEIGFIVQLERRLELAVDPLFLVEKIVVVVVVGAVDTVLTMVGGLRFVLGE